MIFAKLCLGVDWIHSKKVMHKNLHSEHIYVDLEDDDKTIKNIKIGSFRQAKVMQMTL